MTGFGIGLRAKHHQRFLSERVAVDWVEVISENFMNRGGRLFDVLEHVRTNYPVGLHGVAMSLGATTPLNQDYLYHLKALIKRVEPIFVSDHLCWGSFGANYAHDLWPLPFTQEAIDHLVDRIDQVQNTIGRQFMIENVSSYLTFQNSEMNEWTFLSEIAKRSGCAILLDLNNIYVSAVNHRFDPYEYLEAVPIESVKQYHLAGHLDRGDYLLDAHNDHVCDEVWKLYAHAIKRFGHLPTLIEWDDDIPELDVVVRESELAREHSYRARGERERRIPGAQHAAE